MTSLLSIPTFLLLTIPWLNPFAPGPSPPVMPWLVAMAAGSGLLWLEALRRIWSTPLDKSSFKCRWGGPLAFALLTAGLASSLIGLFQYFGLAAPLEPWIRQGTYGEAFANLRQRNQFASLTNMALVALAWLAMVSRTDLAGSRPAGAENSRDQPAMLLAAALLAAGNAASSSRTGLLQLVFLCGLFWFWGGRRQVAVRRVLITAVVVYGISTFALPLLAGLDPFDRGMFARLRDGAPACSSRWLLWSNVLHLIAEKPWLGWGWNELDFAHYATLYNGPRFCEILDNAHNLPLHLAVELGVPVAVLICGGIAWWVWRRRPWGEADPTRQMAWGILAVIGLHSLLEYPLWYGPFQMAAGLCVMLLWSREKPAPVAQYAPNRPPADVIRAGAAIILIASSAYALWDYHRISQLYLAPQDRDAAYVDDTIGKARKSWLFRNQVQFAELTTTPLDRGNAQWTFDTASALLHYSPEPRIIEKVIESAVMLGRDDEAMAHLARYRAAFPKEHAAWARGNARMPEMIESLNQPK
jgi:Virulence factor membrane-bound polymerase, C-terminal/O-Antigen ligase/Protein glycosylation ligase